MPTTITEALAELKTIDKRLEKKQEQIGMHLLRQRTLVDPFDKEGGTVEMIKRERQAIADLQTRRVKIRTEITRANLKETITVGNQTKSIAEWLTWKRDVAPFITRQLGSIVNHINQYRKQLAAKGLTVVSSSVQSDNRDEVLVQIDEAALAKEIEDHETTLGGLDGQFSLKNATIVIDV